MGPAEICRSIDAIGRLINPVKRSSPIKFHQSARPRSHDFAPQTSFLIGNLAFRSFSFARASFCPRFHPPRRRPRAAFSTQEAGKGIASENKVSCSPSSPRVSPIRRFPPSSRHPVFSPLRAPSSTKASPKANQPVHSPSHGILIFR